MNHALLSPAVVVVVIATLVAAITDIFRFKVYNLLTVPLLLSGLAYHAWSAGSTGFAHSMAGAGLGFAFLLVFYLLGGMGGGDVKLLAAVGSWLGIEATFYVLMASFLAAGCYSLGLMLFYRNNREIWTNLRIIGRRVVAMFRYLGAEDRVESEVSRPDRRGRVVPFAAMVAVGVIAALAWLTFNKTP